MSQADKLSKLYSMLIEEKKKLYANNFYLFDKDMMGLDSLSAPHKELCDFIQTSKKNFQLILMPRGSFKTSLVTLGYPIWMSLKNPNIRILVDSETLEKSKSFLSAIKRTYESNEKFIEIFGHLDSNKEETWSKTRITVATRQKNLKEPTIDIAGIGVTKVGMHYDLIIADDLHSEKNVTTKEMIEDVINHYKLLLSLLEPDGKLIIIGTRWDYSDLYSHIIEEESDRFEIFKRQAIQEDGSLLMPDRLSKEFLDNIKKTQGTYLFSCNPYEAPILMSDFSTKPIGEVKVGDEVIGFETGNVKHHRKLVTTKVIDTFNRKAKTQIVKLDSGRQIRCTPDHQWYTGRRDSTHKEYRPVVVGSNMLEVVNTDKDNRDFNYLAGMLDGEGACKYGSISIHQCPIHNPEVYERIGQELDKLEISYQKRDDCYVLRGGRQTKFDILKGNPAKRFQIVNTILNRCGTVAREKHKVISIEQYKKEKVFALQTETGNYVAWGYASKNCQYLNEPVSDESAIFKRDDFQYYKEEDLDQNFNIFMTIDPALSIEKTADYSAIVVGGFTKDEKIYILDIFRERVQSQDLINQIFSMAEKWNPRLIGLEVVAFQKVLQYNIQSEMRLRGKYLPLIELKRDSSESKEMRIRGLQPKYETKSVYHPRQHQNLFDLEFELLRFPRGQTDDIIDAEADLLQIAYPRRKKRSKRAVVYKPRSKFTGI